MACDGYASGEIISGGEETDLSDTSSSDDGPLGFGESSASGNKKIPHTANWHTPSRRHSHRGRDFMVPIRMHDGNGKENRCVGELQKHGDSHRGRDFMFPIRMHDGNGKENRRVGELQKHGDSHRGRDFMVPFRTHDGNGKENRRVGELQKHGDCQSSSSEPLSVASALSELTNTMKQIVGRLDKQETRLASMEQKLKVSSPNSSGSPAGTTKTKVPLAIRSEVRRMYKALCDEDVTFKGYDTNKGVSFNDVQNTVIVNRLIKEVSISNPSFQAGLIKSASYAYYRTLCQEDSLNRRGKLQERNKIRRRRERAIRKLHDRTSALGKSSMNEKDKKKWMNVITLEFMSSEESGSDGEGCLQKKEIPWRSGKVSSFFTELDTFNDSSKSSVAKRQTRQRVVSGLVSNRSIPQGGKIPSWAVIHTPAEKSPAGQ